MKHKQVKKDDEDEQTKKGTIAACANGATLSLMTVLLGDMIDSFGKNQGTNEVVALNFTYLAVFGLVVSSLQVGCWIVTGERQAARIRKFYLKTILRQDIAFFDTETNTGEVIGRMSGDTVLIQDAMGEKVGEFLQQLATLVGGFIVAFIKGWLLTLVMLSTIPPLLISGAAMSIVIAKMASRGQTAYSQAGIIVEQTLGAIRTVASFTGEKRAIVKYNKSLKIAQKAGVQEGLFSGLGLGSVTFVSFGSHALAIWYGAKLILGKGCTGGDVINVIVSVLTGSMSLGQATPYLGAFSAGKAAAYKMFETINRITEIDAYDTSKGKTLDSIHGDIDGTTNALVGQSGSGNSTVISLIERFYDPQAGEILIDGVNIKELQLRWLQEKIGLVSQEPVLFTASIKDNIAYGKDGSTLQEIKVASELANAAKFIDKLPEGLETMVGEHGTHLSGGQKQRIAIAREILKNPRILLLDEATSALDAESERIVQEAPDRVMISRTTVIVVAHRLSTVRNADVIAVIQAGKIIESWSKQNLLMCIIVCFSEINELLLMSCNVFYLPGSHNELLKDPVGAYSQFIQLQDANSESGNGKQQSEFAHQLSRNASRQSEISRQLSRNPRKHSEFARNLNKNPSRHTSLGGLLSRGTSTRGNSGHHSFSMELGFPSRQNIGDFSAENDNDDILPSTKQYKDVPISRLAKPNKPEIPILFLGVKTFFLPPAELERDARFWELICIVLGVASLILSPAKTYLFAVAGHKLINRVRSLCFGKAVHMDIDWFDEPEHSSDVIGARISADAASIRILVGDSLAMLVENIATVTAGLGIAFQASWKLSLIILVLIPLIGVTGWAQMRFMKGFSADAKKKYEEASQVASDALMLLGV
ncbi:hypothetical protein C5167_017985 [Papaver somniferum]|uniref:ABC transmembrane type-1 domain-containing protein n=1 Tax=Papaver somniferum TaxID=3469 RepID=A0A4Y7IN68_PAPSO|nr:hypothetical protein C5167_017985 [Papaver somniferum]